jgi:hypothetical protein
MLLHLRLLQSAHFFLSSQEVKITPDSLFTLFGVYGNVLRVKLLFQKQGTAMVPFLGPLFPVIDSLPFPLYQIQMSEPQGALLAQKYLYGIKAFGDPLVITFSKHKEACALGFLRHFFGRMHHSLRV